MLSIAGWDPSAGAGVLADMKTAAAFGVYGTAVLTSITAQNTSGVQHVEPCPPKLIGQQLASILEDIQIDAIKIGLVPNTDIAQCIAQRLQHFKGPIVLDPVMVASSGDRLLQAEKVQSILDTLLPFTSCVTPNRDEAQFISDIYKFDGASIEDGMRSWYQRLVLQQKNDVAVLLKDGHGQDIACEDRLFYANEVYVLRHQRIDTKNTHGTGCTFSSAIAACLARGHQLLEAVQTAHSYIVAAIEAAQYQQIGHGHGPLNHYFHNEAYTLSSLNKQRSQHDNNDHTQP